MSHQQYFNAHSYTKQTACNFELQPTVSKHFFFSSVLLNDFCCLQYYFVHTVGNIASLIYQPIIRPPQNDWGFELGNEVSLAANERRFKIDSEFIRIELTTTQGTKHVEYHAQIIPRSPQQEYSKASGLPLSVVIIGFDSLSAAHFQRALPEAYKFMAEQMNSVFLKGYSVVGDGTTPALTALMTGQYSLNPNCTSRVNSLSEGFLAQ